MILNFVSIEQLRRKCNSTPLQICQNSQLIKKKTVKWCNNFKVTLNVIYPTFGSSYSLCNFNPTCVQVIICPYLQPRKQLINY